MHMSNYFCYYLLTYYNNIVKKTLCHELHKVSKAFFSLTNKL